MLKKFSDFNNFSENLKYHIDNNLSIVDNIFRLGSDAYLSLLKEVRDLYDSGKLELINELDKELFNETEIGHFEKINDELVPLDLPFLEELEEEIYEAEYKGKEVELNKPKRNTGSGKKYYVYVKDPKTGNIRKVTFGDKKGGLTMKSGSKERRKAFAARHNCADKTDKTTAGYWACRANKYFSTSKTTSSYW